MIKSIPYIALIVLLLVITVPLLSGFINRKSESSMEEGYKKATFAGGCFWCMEPPFEELKGVIDVVAGYSGGEVEDPSYGEVASGNTDHREAVQITYDPEEISYGELLDIYWNHTDPTDRGGQFADRGHQYTTAVFYRDEEQKRTAQDSKVKLEESGKFNGKIVTEILPFENFYPAERRHQNYARKNPEDYYRYKKARVERTNWIKIVMEEARAEKRPKTKDMV